MGYYDEEVQMVLEEIKESGQKGCTWRVPGVDILDPDKPWNTTPGEDTDHGVDILFQPISSGDRQTYTFLQNTTDGKYYVKGLMGRVNFKPSMRDKIVRNEQTLNIEALDVLDPNGEGAILYTMVLSA